MSTIHSNNDLRPNPTFGSSSSTSSLNGSSSRTSPKPKGLKKLRPWSLAAHARRKVGTGSAEADEHQTAETSISTNTDKTNGHNDGMYDYATLEGLPYQDSRVRVHPDQSPRRASDTPQVGIGSTRSQDGSVDGAEVEWEEESDIDDGRVDAYSWVDPSFIGSARLRATPTVSQSDLSGSGSGIRSNQTFQNTTPGNEVAELLENAGTAPSPPAQLLPDDSYAMLLAYQSTSASDSGHGHTPSTNSHAAPLSPVLPTPSESGILRNPNPEWYELVDRTLSDSLSKEELKRQGLWWEMIKGEREYVRDMKTVCDVFIQPLRDCDPPLLSPESRLHAFIAEVFSTSQQIYHAHVRLLGRLMERQRHEWPLMTTATDILLGTLLEIVELYESYMKNYPFAEARVRREQERNPPFRAFLSQRNTYDLTRRRDISVFLSRPVTRLPRILLVLEALYKVTPADHPDKEDIPTAMEILQGVVKSTQPGIESAENKIKLWNTAERLLFKKGEVIELDIADPKRTLVHMGYVFRRVRSETNWHGWQDLRAILLDNYFLLTRDEENGKHVVVSRPIHLDFLNLMSADGVPERRYDSVTRYQRKPGGHMLEPVFQPERLMFPFTITTSSGVNGRTYTLCTAEEWKEKIEGAKTLRKFDIEGNRTFAIHSITVPPEIRDPIMAADTFAWHNRETIAVATSRSVWLGWRRDSKTFRELIKFSSGHISMVSIVPDFGWLLVSSSGSLLAYNLRDMIPTSNPDTWIAKGRLEGQRLSVPEHNIAFARVGVTKGRLLVVYAVHSRNSHQTSLYFYEPLLSSTSYGLPSFRSFGNITVPGYASDLSFFRQTVSVVTEKTFVIAEPGNPTYNSIPTFPHEIPERAMVVRMVSGSKPLAMWQVDESEFLLVYEWGACWVTKFGEVSRKGSFLRWNLTPSYVIFKQPYLLLFDESHSRAEVRDVTSGRVCEVIEEKGMKVFPIHRFGQGVVARSGSGRGLIEIVETVPL
ncbi:hypothetical protein I302_105258 [Kwoniella bestiolae CBS 10118]|uniref:DH domain-containing protein n=1 Tax=Kwoniella bestiolae CBS 10118 TaxID=1296100 RepID=A0A1B9FSL3_9TREE|nr:hypothetical protein I302_08546 [Kwoniella bestiolae CBS 10118]OCF21767.1 hypothetical protein I302_08546 [Kwoniella bestiolae CBS 10118]